MYVFNGFPRGLYTWNVKNRFLWHLNQYLGIADVSIWKQCTALLASMHLLAMPYSRRRTTKKPVSFAYLRHRRRQSLLFVSPTSISVRYDHLKWITPYLFFTFCKVYLHYLINYHRVNHTTRTPQHPIIMYDQSWDGNLKERAFDYFKVHRVDSHCLFYAERGHNKDAFYVTLQTHPSLVWWRNVPVCRMHLKWLNETGITLTVYQKN